MADQDDQYTSVHWDQDATDPSASGSGAAGDDKHNGGSSGKGEFSSSSSGGAKSTGLVGMVGGGSGYSYDTSLGGASSSSNTGAGYSPAMSRFQAQDRPELPRWQGYLKVQVGDARKEGEGTKDMYISYGVRAEVSKPGQSNSWGAALVGAGRGPKLTSRTCAPLQTNLPHFDRTRITNRRRYNDFSFLREALVRDFPACVVAPLPEKHRLGERAHAVRSRFMRPTRPAR